MEIKRGTSRIVIVLPKLGIVIKLARTYPLAWVKHLWFLWRLRRRMNFWLELKDHFNAGVDDVSSFDAFLLCGLCANWQEWRYWKQHRFRALVPTYWSLFGLCNIQAYGNANSMDLNGWALVFQRLLVATQRDIWEDNHCFCVLRNFVDYAGTIRLVDYGSLKTQRVLDQWNEQIYSVLNPSHK